MFPVNLKFFSWESLRREWRDIDIFLVLIPTILTIVGAIAIHSSAINYSGLNYYWLQHLIIGGVGLFVVMSLARWQYQQLLHLHWITYFITNVILAIVLIGGTSANGAQSWITIGDFNFQPSEFAKVGVIITLAALLHERPIKEPLDIPKVMWPLLLPCALILKQPDLGTFLVFCAIALGMMYWGGASFGWVVLIVSPLVSLILFSIYIPAWLVWVALMGAVAWYTLPLMRAIGLAIAVVVNLISAEVGSFAWSLLHEYQKKRLLLFIDPTQDPLDGGYHLIQSRIAIGAGKIWGRGIMHGTQTQLNFIPEQHTDFIFSAIGEEMGFVGSMFVLLAFLVICWRLLAVAVKSRDNFGSLMAIGVFAMILFQTTINVGMTIGVAPITGIPLPWLSYGRSALITNFIALGLVESVAAHRRMIKF
jgi:rod shape determining protein RodA